MPDDSVEGRVDPQPNESPEPAARGTTDPNTTQPGHGTTEPDPRERRAAEPRLFMTRPHDPPPIEMAAEPFDMTPPPPEAADGQAPVRGVSRTRKIVLGCLLVAGLAGAATIGTAAWRITVQKDARLATPPQIAELKRDDSDRAESAADYLRTALAAEVELKAVVGAVYTDAGGASRSVLFFGGTTMLWTPEQDLDTVLELVSDKTGALTDVHEVSPGGLGGVMKCGATTTADGAMGVCGWADHGSIAVGLFPGRQPDESAPLLRQIRDAVQERD